MFFMADAFLTGSVDYSTTILFCLETPAIWRAHNSTYFRSAAIPFSLSFVLVDMLTDINIISASSIALSTSAKKRGFLLWPLLQWYLTRVQKQVIYLNLMKSKLQFLIH